MSVTKKNFRPCDGKDYCKALADRIQPAHSKGFALLSIVNLGRAMKSWGFLVYKKSPSDRGIVLNYCPFCGKALYNERGVFPKESPHA